MKPIYVTMPFLPRENEFEAILDSSLKLRILTHNGNLHQLLEQQLKEKLDVTNLSLINNGTIALEVAIQALDLKGKVITTPYNFIATANSILLKGLNPK